MGGPGGGILLFPAEKIIYRNFKDIGKSDKLNVCDETDLTLKLGKAGRVHIDAVYLKLRQQFLLLHTLLLSDKLYTVAYQISISQFLFA